MKRSCFIEKNGVPYIKIGDEELPLAAYITYFEERNDYECFAELGFKIYSVTLSTSARPINTSSGFMPYISGIFDKRNEPDFSIIDASIRKILGFCKDGYIFPRIYMTMPVWWCEEHLGECENTNDGLRECLYSEVFRQDCGEMLKKIIAHINRQDYADRILGYQISGGNTQEWFHINRTTGSFTDAALPYFNKYLTENGYDLKPLSKMPSELIVDGELRGEYSLAYADFANDSVAETVNYFCRIAKEMAEFKQVVGTFYGYALEVVNPLEGTHALSKLLDSPYIDFFSSPNSYVNSRALGIDWGDMMPVDSVKLHGKVCFLECDIRTCNSLSPGESRVGADPRNYYTNAVWRGPSTKALSAMAMRKCYARQITHRHGFWWFDMFGKWYDGEELYREAECSLALLEKSEERALDFPTELAVFVDERAYKYQKINSAESKAVYNIRTSLGASGVSYHIYLIEDFDRVIRLENSYKAFIFATTESTNNINSAINYCRKNDISYIKLTDEKYSFTADEWRSFARESGVHLYTVSGEDVIYVGAGLFALHANEGGKKSVKLPRAVKVRELFSSADFELTDQISFEASEFETKIFELLE